jgi:hypothetical protein
MEWHLQRVASLVFLKPSYETSVHLGPTVVDTTLYRLLNLYLMWMGMVLNPAVDTQIFRTTIAKAGPSLLAAYGLGD